jgi:hypothetical protein
MGIFFKKKKKKKNVKYRQNLQCKDPLHIPSNIYVFPKILEEIG